LKRFIFLFIVGALMIVSGQVALSLGVHPGHLVSLRFLVQSSLGLVLGSATIASGMLGLAEGYEKNAGQLSRLLNTKQVADDLEIAVKDQDGLGDHSQGFWKAYRNSALAVCLFLAGFLGIGTALADAGFLLYVVGLSGGIGVLGLVSLILGFRALRAVRLTHRSVEDSTRTLAAQPDLSAERTTTPEPAVRWAIRRQPPITYSRHLDVRGRSRASIRR